MTSYGCGKCGWRIDLHRQQPPPVNCLYCGQKIVMTGSILSGSLPLGSQLALEQQDNGVWWGQVLVGTKTAAARRTDLLDLVLELTEKGRALVGR